MDLTLFRKHLQQIQESKESRLKQIEDYYIIKNHDGGRLVYKGNPNHGGEVQAFVAANGVTRYVKNGDLKPLGIYRNSSNDQELINDLKKKLA